MFSQIVALWHPRMRFTFDSLNVGTETSWVHHISLDEVNAFASLSGDTNPIHMDFDYARRQGFTGRVVHGMLVSAFLSRVLGTDLPGAGVFWLSQETRFVSPVYIEDEIRIVVRVKHKSVALRTLLLETDVLNQRGDRVLQGEAKVMVLEQPRELDWKDTVALITGSSRGIGSAIALAFGRKGAKVAVHYHSQRKSAEEVAAGIHAVGGQASVFAADLLQPDGPQSLAAAVRERFGAVHVLVNNASPPIRRALPAEIQLADLDLSLERICPVFLVAHAGTASWNEGSRIWTDNTSPDFRDLWHATPRFGGLCCREERIVGIVEIARSRSCASGYHRERRLSVSGND